jgi:putative membrane protein
MSMFSNEEKARVSEAIGRAERKTAGEIVVVVAAASDDYLFVPVLAGAFAGLLVPWLLIFFTPLGLAAIYLTQLCVFLGVSLAALPRRVRTALAPKPIKRLRARRHAMEQFLAQNLHTTSQRTGVLIFVSVAERQVEIVADAEIDRRVAAGTWQAIVDELTAALAKGEAANGLIAAVAAVGAHLAQHFPPETRDHNELPDHLIVLQ